MANFSNSSFSCNYLKPKKISCFKGKFFKFEFFAGNIYTEKSRALRANFFNLNFALKQKNPPSLGGFFIYYKK